MTAPDPRDGAADLFDYAFGRQVLGFAARSLRRHWALALVVFAVVVAAALAGLEVLPRTYKVEVRILTARNQVMPALGNPGRAVPREADAPTQAASELILRRDNLVALVKQTSLVDQWEQGRAPALKVKDAVQAFFKGQPREEDKLEALVGLLEKRLKVTTSEGTVSIQLTWPDAQMAYQLVDAAQQNFIETRHALEVSTITEAISILEWHATKMREYLQTTLDELRHAREAARDAPAVLVRGAPAAPVVRRVEARPRPADQELQQARAMLAAKRKALGDVEGYRHKRLVELQALLAEQTATYAAAHPLVVATQDSIAALSRDSPQIEALRRETLELEREVAAREAQEPRETVAAVVEAPRPEPMFEVRRELAGAPREPPGPREEDTSVEYLKGQLELTSAKYQDLQGRIEGARIELDTARAAFKYRYSVTKPAQVPKEPESPKPAMVVVGGLFAALVLALFAAVAADLRRGRVVEAWQVERGLGLRVLAEVRRP